MRSWRRSSYKEAERRRVEVERNVEGIEVERKGKRSEVEWLVVDVGL
jgi:hypothetical protein